MKETHKVEWVGADKDGNPKEITETIAIELLPPGVPCKDWHGIGREHCGCCPDEDTSVWRFVIRNANYKTGSYISYNSMTKRATEKSTRVAARREFVKQVNNGDCL